MNTVLSQVLAYIITAVALAILGAFVKELPKLIPPFVAWLNIQIESARTLIGTRNWEIVTSSVRGLVIMAEQSGMVDTLLKLGMSKKEWVLSQIEVVLVKYSIDIDLHLIEAEIEKVVWDEFNKAKIQIPNA